jgi:hypothetical protein
LAAIGERAFARHVGGTKLVSVLHQRRIEAKSTPNQCDVDAALRQYPDASIDTH